MASQTGNPHTFGTRLFRLGLWCLTVAFVFAPNHALTVQTEALSDNAGRRDATLSYYAFHIAKLDAHVSLCDGARTEYRVDFKDVVDNSGTGVPADVMNAYDTRYENFIAGLGDVECVEIELTHYRSRATRQIKNLKRDLKALE